MTDKQMAELLVLFNEIEDLMDKRGAKGMSFSDKVKSFNKKTIKPKKPGNIGHKFYFKDNQYNIKQQYENEKTIQEELKIYSKFKAYNKAQYSVLDGNYKTLIKIGHERNQLMHIYNYELEDYDKFVSVCRSMVEYLKSPKKRQSGRYEKFDFRHKNTLKEEKKLKILWYTLFPDKRKIMTIEKHTLPFNKRSKYMIFDTVLDQIVNIKVMIMFLIVMVVVIGLKYSIAEGVLPQMHISATLYLFIGFILYLLVHNHVKVLKFIGRLSKQALKLTYSGLMEIFILVFQIIVVLFLEALPYIIGLILLYFFVIYKS